MLLLLTLILLLMEEADGASGRVSSTTRGDETRREANAGAEADRTPRQWQHSRSRGEGANANVKDGEKLTGIQKKTVICDSKADQVTFGLPQLAQLMFRQRAAVLSPHLLTLLLS